ncbi:hypothetical protein J6590_038233 [Homalodisca vitripennis]|nr:hypothetical protein J6590_038233 [Homalodisca vitripennis]
MTGWTGVECGTLVAHAGFLKTVHRPLLAHDVANVLKITIKSQLKITLQQHTSSAIGDAEEDNATINNNLLFDQDEVTDVVPLFDNEVEEPASNEIAIVRTAKTDLETGPTPTTHLKKLQECLDKIKSKETTQREASKTHGSTWNENGPDGARYNRSKHWFDSICFEDWFESHFLHHVRKFTGTISSIIKRYVLLGISIGRGHVTSQSNLNRNTADSYISDRSNSSSGLELSGK